MSTADSVQASLAWRWCLLYTALAPGESGARRRGELLSHLWESEAAHAAGRAPWSVVLRGAVDDVLWAVGLTLGRAGRSFGTPMPYVVLAGLTPIGGIAAGALPTPELMLALVVAGFVLLAVAAALALVQRRRNGGSA